MMGRKMALFQLAVILGPKKCRDLPECEEEKTEEDGQNSDTDGLCLLENLDDAVQEGSNPEEPFKQSGQHDSTDNGDIDDLRVVSICMVASERLGYSHP